MLGIFVVVRGFWLGVVLGDFIFISSNFDSVWSGFR